MSAAEKILYELFLLLEDREDDGEEPPEPPPPFQVIDEEPISLSLYERTVHALRRPELGTPAPPPAVAFHRSFGHWKVAATRDGGKLAVLKSRSLETHGLSAGTLHPRRICKLAHDPQPWLRTLCWSGDGSLLALASSTSTLLVFDDNLTKLRRFTAAELALPASVAALFFRDVEVQRDDEHDEHWEELLLVLYDTSVCRVRVAPEGAAFHTDQSKSHAPPAPQRVSPDFGEVWCVDFEPSSGKLVLGGSSQQGAPALGVVDVTDKGVELKWTAVLPGVPRPRSSWRPRTTAGVGAVSISPRGDCFGAVTSSGTLLLFDTSEPSPKAEWKGRSFLRAPDSAVVGDIVVNGDEDAMLCGLDFVGVQWWDDERIVVTQRNGHVTLTSGKQPRQTNLLGSLPEKFRWWPLVKTLGDGHLLVVECERRVYGADQACDHLHDVRSSIAHHGRLVLAHHLRKSPSSLAAARLASEEGTVEHSALWERLLNVLIGYIPREPESQWLGLRNVYRLTLLSQTTPTKLFVSRVQGACYGEALRLATTFHLNTDMVFQAQWHSAVKAAGGRVTQSSIRDLLGQVNDEEWVMSQCLDWVPPTPEEARLLLEYALDRTQPERVRLAVQEDLTVELTEQEKRVCWERLRIVQYISRLQLFTAMNDQFDPAKFQEFRSRSVKDSAVALAIAEEFHALHVLFNAFEQYLLPYRLSVLEHVPETTPPRLFAHLLPRVSGDKETRWPNQKRMPTAQTPERFTDWVEADTVLDVLFPSVERGVGEQERLAAIYAVDGAVYDSSLVCRQYPCSADDLTEWYWSRAQEIDRASGQLLHASELVELAARCFGVPQLTHARQSLCRARRWVLGARVDVVGLEVGKLERMSLLERLRLLVGDCVDDPAVAVERVLVHGMPMLNSTEGVEWEDDDFASALAEHLAPEEEEDDHSDEGEGHGNDDNEDREGSDHDSAGGRRQGSDDGAYVEAFPHSEDGQVVLEVFVVDHLLPLSLDVVARMFHQSRVVVAPSERVIQGEERMLRLALTCIYHPTLGAPTPKDIEAMNTIFSSLPEPTPSATLKPALAQLHRAVDRLASHLDAIELLDKYQCAKPMHFLLSFSNAPSPLQCSDEEGDEENRAVRNQQANEVLREVVGAFTRHVREQEGLGLPQRAIDARWSDLAADLVALRSACFPFLPEFACLELAVAQGLRFGRFAFVEKLLLHSDPPPPKDQVEDVVVGIAQEFLNSAPRGSHSDVGLAYKALLVLRHPSFRVSQEVDLIHAVRLLDSHNLSVPPLEVRLHPNKTELVQRLLDSSEECVSCGDDDSCPPLLLARYLGISDGPPYNKVLELVARHAWTHHELDDCLRWCRELTSRKHGGAWDVCMNLCEAGVGSPREQSDMLSFAITHCPPALIETLVSRWHAHNPLATAGTKLWGEGEAKSKGTRADEGSEGDALGKLSRRLVQTAGVLTEVSVSGIKTTAGAIAAHSITKRLAGHSFTQASVSRVMHTASLIGRHADTFLDFAGQVAEGPGRGDDDHHKDDNEAEESGGEGEEEEEEEGEEPEVPFLPAHVDAFYGEPGSNSRPHFPPPLLASLAMLEGACARPNNARNDDNNSNSNSDLAPRRSEESDRAAPKTSLSVVLVTCAEESVQWDKQLAMACLLLATREGCDAELLARWMLLAERDPRSLHATLPFVCHVLALRAARRVCPQGHIEALMSLTCDGVVDQALQWCARPSAAGPDVQAVRQASAYVRSLLLSVHTLPPSLSHLLWQVGPGNHARVLCAMACDHGGAGWLRDAVRVLVDAGVEDVPSIAVVAEQAMAQCLDAMGSIETDPDLDVAVTALDSPFPPSSPLVAARLAKQLCVLLSKGGGNDLDQADAAAARQRVRACLGRAVGAMGDGQGAVRLVCLHLLECLASDGLEQDAPDDMGNLKFLKVIALAKRIAQKTRSDMIEFTEEELGDPEVVATRFLSIVPEGGDRGVRVPPAGLLADMFELLRVLDDAIGSDDAESRHALVCACYCRFFEWAAAVAAVAADSDAPGLLQGLNKFRPPTTKEESLRVLAAGNRDWKGLPLRLQLPLRVWCSFPPHATKPEQELRVLERVEHDQQLSFVLRLVSARADVRESAEAQLVFGGPVPRPRVKASNKVGVSDLGGSDVLRKFGLSAVSLHFHFQSAGTSLQSGWFDEDEIVAAVLSREWALLAAAHNPSAFHRIARVIALADSPKLTEWCVVTLANHRLLSHAARVALCSRGVQCEAVLSAELGLEALLDFLRELEVPQPHLVEWVEGLLLE